MKKIEFRNTALKDMKKFPVPAKHEAGYQLMLVQFDKEPTDWKPMSSIGMGVKEIRIHAENEFRVIYIAKFSEAVYVLHAFQKKSQKTPKKDIDLAQKRLKQLQQERDKK